MTISNNSQLLAFLHAGKSAEYLFFWGHRKPKSGEVSKSCFSQWYPAEFEVDGVTFPTAEHYMMHEKARLFGDMEVAEEMLSASTPADVKKLGRKVRNFDQKTWEETRVDIVVRGNLAKFSQNAELCEFLLSTGAQILVEASPVDSIWGIGLAVDNPEVAEPEKWKGLNLLGYALMQVRDTLQTR